MGADKTVLDTMKKAGEPLNAGKIADLSGLDRKEVDKAMKKLKAEGKATFKGKKVKIEDISNVKPGLRVIYTGDTKPCDNVVKISKEADLLIHDATFLEEDEGKAHADVKQAAKTAKQAKVKELILTHFSRRYATKDSIKELEDEAKKIFPNTRAADDFMRVKLKK